MINIYHCIKCIDKVGAYVEKYLLCKIFFFIIRLQIYWLSLWMSRMLCYLHANYCPRPGISAIVIFSLHQVLVNSLSFREFWTEPFIYSTGPDCSYSISHCLEISYLVLILYCSVSACPVSTESEYTLLSLGTVTKFTN